MTFEGKTVREDPFREVDESTMLSNPQNTIAVLQKYDIRLKKRFGQNFLIDQHVLHKIIDGAQVSKEDVVLEIGPGIGTLTQYLSVAAKEVIAVEIDRNLIPILEDTLTGYENVQVQNGDIQKLNLLEFVNQYNKGKPIKVVANLPYNVATSIIMDLLEKKVPLESITVMVQKEVAKRMEAQPGTKDYGALSVAVSYYAQPYIVANVPSNCFIPRPNVDSAVIRLTRYATPTVKTEDEHLLFQIVRAAFNQRRKTLVNALHNFPELSVTKEQVQTALVQMDLPVTVRGEELSLSQFAQLSDCLLEQKKATRTCEV